MENVFKLQKEANKAYETADHLIYITYPLINEVKLTVTIMEKLNLAINKAMEALLYYDWIYKRISMFPNDSETRFKLFKEKTAVTYKIPRETIMIIQEIQNLVTKRKQSPMEFTRRDEYIICSPTYRLDMLDLKKVKKYSIHVKQFIQKTNSILENARRFRE